MKTRIINFTIFEEQINGAEGSKTNVHFTLDFADRRTGKNNMVTYHIETVFVPRNVPPLQYTVNIYEAINSWLTNWHELLNFDNIISCREEFTEYLLAIQKSVSTLDIPKLVFKRIELPWK